MKGQTIVLATNNVGKIQEINAALTPLGIRTQAQSELALSEVEEPHFTFVENALAKARHAAKHCGLAAIADDSGIVVDVLNGAPGVHSARYAGPFANADLNIRKLLNALQNIPRQMRTAKFYCVLVYLKSEKDPCPLICQGSWKGLILFEPQGQHGFGYDPIFYLPSHQCSAAELSLEEKNRISHRGQALQQLIDKLKEELIDG